MRLRALSLVPILALAPLATHAEPAPVVAATAIAEAPPAPPPGRASVSFEVAPLLGTTSPTPAGWSGFLVRVQNNEAKPLRGEVEVLSRLHSDQMRFRATAPFVVGAGTSVIVRLPTHGNVYGETNVVARDDAGVVLGSHTTAVTNMQELFLLDVSETSRLKGALHDAAISPLYSPWGGYGAYGTGPQLKVGAPRFDPATGDPILPDRAALYAPASAVLLRSDTLVKIGAAELEALSGYVLAGGTLAVALARPEDLRSPLLAAFAGGEITPTSPHSETLRELVLPAPPSNATKSIPFAESAAEEVGKTLAGFSGGNLHGSRYGASATYGLGEFHLLAFDPTRKPAVDDPWVQARVLDLTRRAFDRKSSIVYRQGGAPGTVDLDRVRQELDPNESSRWGIAVAAILLIAYAVLAGPVNFTMHANKGKPLRALVWLPILSAIAFFAVVLIGLFAKGLTGRSRHLTLVEAGAGMTKGTARRWRGFFTPRSKDLTVRTSDGSSVVTTAVVASPATIDDHMLVDRDGARLVDLAILPWQTVVVREDGFADVGEGISIVHEGEKDTAVTNRSGHDLRAAILMLPGLLPRYFPTIKDGERVLASAGKDLKTVTAGTTWIRQVNGTRRAGTLDLHPLSSVFVRPIVEPDAPGLAEAWLAVEQSAGGLVDWFPEDVPVLLGQLDGGEGKTSDAGLKLERDRLLVRIVGYGGRP
ncbi:hypothetical protein [Polyangium fumosum]|uniref:Uncharacterized protein n=1 Tax=Polyangium fumosum TaxID=889272 RepID=A0A4U1JJ26_9BACT|nr:hypothetical protein [Polyangium fumosum]TKD12466.1 hypothetical protein E8A74_05050 [Polyangium fumosum]